jgi:hypothetical protein
VLCLAEGERLSQSHGVTIQTCCGDLAAFHPAPRPSGHLILESCAPRLLELPMLLEQRPWIEEGP